MKTPKSVYVPARVAAVVLFLIGASLALAGAMCAYQGHLDRDLASQLTGVLSLSLGFALLYRFYDR